jgi:hypothetical protein
MSYKIILTPNAIANVEDGYAWYENQFQGLGDNFLFQLEIAYSKIAKNPTFYGFIDDEKIVRDLLVDKFPYLVVYKIVDAQIHILSIHYAKKHPSKKIR